MSNNEDLHGNAPDKSKTALILIDVISDFEFVDGEKLFNNALPMARRIVGLKKKAKQSGAPVIYVNNNFGKWQSEFKKLSDFTLKYMERVLKADTRPSAEINFAELANAA